jgi:hypothetical protein
MSDDEAMRIISVLAVYSQFIVTNNPANHKIFVAGIRARLTIGMETENIEKDDLQQAIKRFKNVNSIENYIAEIQSFLKLRNEDLSALPKVAAVQKWVE